MRFGVAAMLAVLAGPALAAQPLDDGVFGFTMGMPGSELHAQQKSRSGYESEVPKGYGNRYDGLEFLAPSKTGLCQIITETPVINTASTGSGLKKRLDAIAEGFDTVIGPHEEADHLDEKSTLTGTRDYMESLRTGARFSGVRWTKDSAKKDLPSDLQQVMAIPTVTGEKQGRIIVIFQFKNIDGCRQELKSAPSGAQVKDDHKT